jgi:Caspase domain
MPARSSFFRRAGATLLAVCGLMLAAAPGTAQESSFFAPKRMALLIGNADYNQNGAFDLVRTPGRMKDLVHPCKDDVRILKKKLEQAGWRSEEIDPKCNLTGPQLREAIEAFTSAYRHADQGTLAILFFSGHGAQIGDQGFIFGVDATMDWSNAPTDQFPSAAGLLGKAAISLPHIVYKEVSQDDSRYPLDERSSGFVVLLDACRNNSLLSDGPVKETITALSPSNQTWTGLLVGFATRGGQFARDDYPKSAASLYTAKLSAFLNQPANVRAVLDRTAAEVRAASERMDPNFKQFPEAVGLISVSLCIKRDCPLAWKGEAEDEIEDEPVVSAAPPAPAPPAPAPPAPAAADPNVVVPASGATPGAAISGAGLGPGQGRMSGLRGPAGLLWRVSTAAQESSTPTQLAPAFDGRSQLPPQSQSQTQRSLKSQFIAEEKRRRSPIIIYDAERDLAAPIASGTFTASMAFDVRVCTDGVNQDLLEARGRALAQRLADKARSENQADGVKISKVRLLFLSAMENSVAGYRFAHDTVLYDTAQDVPPVRDWDEVTWARWAVPNLDERFKWAGRQVGQSPNLISFFICAEPAPQSVVTTLYVQTPSEDSRSTAKAIESLVVATAGLRPANGIEVRANSPNFTQFRYFHLEDRDAVFRAASSLETARRLRVGVSYQPWFADRTAPGTAELWLGKNDQTVWDPAMNVRRGGEAVSKALKSPGELNP